MCSNDAFNRQFSVVTARLFADDSASIVMPYQIRTISKLRLLEPVGIEFTVG